MVTPNAALTASPRTAGLSTAGGRPRAVVLGELPAATLRELTRSRVELAQARTGDGLPPAADVLVLGRGVPAVEVARTLAALDGLAGADRPELVLVVPEGRPVRALARAARQATEVVRGGGAAELAARVWSALRRRELKVEVARRDTELDALKHRLETLSGRMADELRLAGSLQRSLLPTPVQHARLELAREFIPFREVGGDYYDALPLGHDRDRIAFAIGDVMGKGIAAALLAASLRAAVRSQLQGCEVVPREVVSRVNRLFLEVSTGGRFASLFFGVFDLAGGRLHYVNAGHHYPLLVRRDGTVLELVAGGTVLGLVEEADYEETAVELGAEDLLIFYTDGVTDRLDPAGEPFGSERLKEAAVRSRGDAPRIVLYSVLGDVQGWSCGTPAQDDATLVVARYR